MAPGSPWNICSRTGPPPRSGRGATGRCATRPGWPLPATLPSMTSSTTTSCRGCPRANKCDAAS
eukprot:4764082-Lingulodinium_polyedra.AAC.1